MTLADATTATIVTRLRLLAVLIAVLLIVTHGAVYFVGRANGSASETKADAAAVERAYQAEVRRADQAIKRAQRTGAAAEAARGRVDRHFNQLEQEAASDAPASVDDCELPAERLRRWRAANAGPVGSTTITEPDSGTGASAPAGQRPDAGSGGQPS